MITKICEFTPALLCNEEEITYKNLRLNGFWYKITALKMWRPITLYDTTSLGKVNNCPYQ